MACFSPHANSTSQRTRRNPNLRTHSTLSTRSIVEDLPLAALLGQRIAEPELERTLPIFYRYFDLSNEEAFLRSQGRVRPETLANWVEGIEQNMARPAFQQAWDSMLPLFDGSFEALKTIESRRRRLSRGAAVH